MTVSQRWALLVVAAAIFGWMWHWDSTAQLAGSPNADARCPVCGMFVSKYPEWVAQIRFIDGSSSFFDGPKDLFKFYFFKSRYGVAEGAEKQIEAIFVTDYYSIQKIEAKQAVFVMGSDVFGPMGRELVPFESASGALEFFKDHSGEKILNFEEMTPDLILNLD